MSQTLTRNDLWSLEEYAVRRPAFRSEVLAHKKNRRIAFGRHIVLLFEDLTTIRYQIQEMLRIEKVFEAAGIQEELDAYNPLIPDGTNWKCTLLIAYDDPDERRVRLEALLGIEDTVWLRVGDSAPVHAVADEDLDRSRDSKTASVHFLRYELTPEMISAMQQGAELYAGIAHQAYPVEAFAVPRVTRDALARDLEA
tara:strand:+ start:161 stop:751 length:591 start_codon:yes stop_codon:yes gene_type:complete